ncbi:MAG: tetratricopeptide repeat protein [Bacteroidales bacterium]|nr:tetratricopeptide repeat protein [Bacteroidales bacterium]
MKRQLKYFFLLLVLAAGPTLRAANPDSLMTQANRAYDAQKYDTAIDLYNRVLNEGWVSPKLYYNLGDSYFRKKNLPEAILYYEKAKKLDPNNENIQYNLGIANSMIVDKIDQVPQFFLKRWWNYFYNLFDADTWTVFFLISFALLVLFVGIFFFSHTRRNRQWSFFVALLFLIITAGSLGLASQRTYYNKNQKEAIVFTPSVTVKSSPSPNSVDLFVIHDGTKVRILDHVDGWIKIKISNGSIGWLPEVSVKTI